MTGQIDPETGLTARRVAFCRAYVANGMNGTQAAITAGYAEGNASAESSFLLKIPEVSQYVETLAREAADVAQITPEWVLLEVVENLRAAKGEAKFSDVNKAAELLGKYHALWTDRLESDGSMTHSIRVEFDEPDDA